MIRHFSELLDTPSPPKPTNTSTANGHTEDMDLDEAPTQHGSETVSWDKMDTSESVSSDARYNEMVSKTIAYGRELNDEFKDETDPQFRDQFKDTMNELFGMLAFQDARKSPAARWLEVGERVKVAEGLNSAILGEYI